MFDAVIVGSGGAGLSAALALKKYTDNFLIITAGEVGHSNTARAHGGIQIPVLPEDSWQLHYEDTVKGGNFKGNPQLIRTLTQNSAHVLFWLNSMGVDFDRFSNDHYIIKCCEGTSVCRVMAKGGFTGSMIVGALYREIKRKNIRIAKQTILKSISQKKDSFIILLQSSNKFSAIETKYLIITSGGSSLLHAHKEKYGTTNQPCTDFKFYDSLTEMKIKMVFEKSFQFHPLCISLRGSLYGLPVPETLKTLGAQIVDKHNKQIEVQGLKRDELTVKLFNLINEKKAVLTGELVQESFILSLTPALKASAVVLDTFSFFFKKLLSHGINPFADNIPISPMIHYQNGGIEINTFCETSVDRIYAAGEVTGGIHGTNRLMGNSLLDVLTFGTIAGESCGKKIINGG
jgi:aspartate oxidase